MIRRIPINAFQDAVGEILKTKQTTPVYGSVPGKVEPPYIVISDYSFETGGSKGADITDMKLEIEIWSRYKGKGEINTIAEDIATVLTAWPIDLDSDGYRVMSKDVVGGRGERLTRNNDDYFCGIVFVQAKIQNNGPVTGV